MLQLSREEFTIVQGLFECSREFFAQPRQYKESFKFFPVPGGYMTPYPGANETFELRRGLMRCPSELAQAMGAFQLFERFSKAVCREVARDIGFEVDDMFSEMSPTLRCIHYDEPHKSLGAVDSTSPPSPSMPLPRGSSVRIIGLQGAERQLNGVQAEIMSSDGDGALVRIRRAPKTILQWLGSKADSFRVSRVNLRLICLEEPGVYAAHADSSLVTVAPKSSAAGLEVKDVRSGEWLRIEEHMRPDEVLVFTGDPLDYVTAHKYPALMHKPVVPAKGGPVPPTVVNGHVEHRIATPFFFYPRDAAVLAPRGLPKLTFDNIQGNDNGCRDSFPWKMQSCYFSDMVYSQQPDAP